MTRYRIPIAAALFLLPILIRTVWFNQGLYWRTDPVQTPDFNAYTIPQPPLSTPLPALETAADAPPAIILLDQAHGNLFSASEVSSLIGALNDRNAQVETVESGGYRSRSLADQLKYATAYLTICPVESFAPDEIQQLTEFVGRGGRLLVLTDPTRSGNAAGYYDSGPVALAQDVNAANSLLAGFDLTFTDDYLYNMTAYEGNFRNVIFEDFSPDAFTDGFGEIVLYAARSIQTRTGIQLMTGPESMLSSLTDSGGGLSAAALDAGHNVLAIGDMTFFQTPYNQSADNPLLIRRIASFLLEAERIHPLIEFPYVFAQPVAILPLDDIHLTANLLGPIRALQEDLAGVGVSATLAPSPMVGKDLIVMGTYSSEDIEAYLHPLGVTLNTAEAGISTIKIPGMGTIKQKGTGLILLLKDTSRTSLILLAADGESLTSLLDVIGPSGFSDCLLQGEIAICGIGSSSDGSGDDWWTAPETTGELTPTPEPTEPAG